MRFARFACLAAAALACAGCSLLVAFDDQPSCDGGRCDDDASVPSDSATPFDGASDAGAGAESDAPKDAPADAVDMSCKGLTSGMYCATDHLKGYLGAPTDLVNCDGGAVYTVTHCGEAGCISMVDPFPDCCNECPQKSNGTYCGRDFAGFPAANADILIGCQAGQVVQNFACPHGCKSSGSDASCYP